MNRKIDRSGLKRLVREAVKRKLAEDATSAVSNEAASIIGGAIMARREDIVKKLVDSQMEFPVRIEDIDPFAEYAAREVAGQLYPTIVALLKRSYTQALKY